MTFPPPRHLSFIVVIISCAAFPLSHSLATVIHLRHYPLLSVDILWNKLHKYFMYVRGEDRTEKREWSICGRDRSSLIGLHLGLPKGKWVCVCVNLYRVNSCRRVINTNWSAFTVFILWELIGTWTLRSCSHPPPPPPPHSAKVDIN